MAGTFGHEAEHRRQSEDLYRLSWQEKIDRYGHRVLATGYSCRSQVKRLAHRRIAHPVEILAAHLAARPHGQA